MPSTERALSPEARLLLATADPDGVDEAIADGLRRSLEWGRLYGLALRERAAGPLWSRLAPFEDRLPERFARTLEQAAAVEGLRQQQLLRRLAESLHALRTSGVKPILLKGSALLQTRYTDPGQRPMTDIDLLVPEGEAERAREALLDAGWRWNRERFPEEMYDRHYHMPPLQDAGGSGIGLEIHTGLLLPGHPFPFGPTDLADGSRPVDVRAEPALVPGPGIHLLYVCLHFAWSHCLGGGGWRTFRDTAVLTRTREFDWDSFRRSAEEAGATAGAYWTLRLGRDLAGLDVPASVLDALRPPLPDGLLAWLGRHYALGLFPGEDSCPSVRLRQGLWLLGNGSGRGGVRSLVEHGGTRPWDFSDDFRRLVEEGGTEHNDKSLFTRHVRDVGRWRSYLRSVALGTGRRR